MLQSLRTLSLGYNWICAICITQNSVDWRNIPGWDAVDRLTDHLLTITALSMTSEETFTTVLLYNQLDKYDKCRTSFTARHQPRLLTGRFKVSKKRQGVSEGVDSARRLVLTFVFFILFSPQGIWTWNFLFFHSCLCYKIQHFCKSK